MLVFFGFLSDRVAFVLFMVSDRVAFVLLWRWRIEIGRAHV